MFGRILYRLLFILLILTITSCGIHQSPKCDKYYYLGTARTNTTLTIKIDKHFDLAQQIQIQKAFDTWTKMSDYKLIFNLEFNKPRPALYKEWSAPTKSAGLFFWNLEKTQAQMTSDQIEQWKTYWGLMVYGDGEDRKSTRLNSSHITISYAVFCLKKKNHQHNPPHTPNHTNPTPPTPPHPHHS